MQMSCSVFCTTALRPSATSQLAEPRPRGMWGVGGVAAAQFGVPLQVPRVSAPPSLILPAQPCPGTPGEAMSWGGSCTDKEQPPALPSASRLSLAGLGCGRGRKWCLAQPGQPAVHPQCDADPRARTVPRASLAPAPVPVAADSTAASSSPFWRRHRSTGILNGHPLPLLMPNPRSPVISLGGGFARSGNPKPRRAGSAGAPGSGSLLRTLSPRTSSCGSACNGGRG